MYALLVGVIVVCVVVLYQKAAENETDLDRGNIEQLLPTRDAKILQQEPIGIDLAPGYEGTLALNGEPLPEDQLGVVPALNRVTFTPGPGKAYEALPAGQNCLKATYWKTETGPSQSTDYTWCFTVL
ncbi:MAG TPA: hypothetical protein VIY72_11020 [Acidimicrobiales bacterium]